MHASYNEWSLGENLDFGFVLEERLVLNGMKRIKLEAV